MLRNSTQRFSLCTAEFLTPLMIAVITYYRFRRYKVLSRNYVIHFLKYPSFNDRISHFDLVKVS